MKYRHKHGFTLLELMAVVAIIGILSAIAYPSYRDYIIRGRIPEGLALLSNERIVMEKFLADNRTYIVTPLNNGPIVRACDRYPIATNNFSVACDTVNTPPTATTYLLVATGLNSMAGFSYTIDETGAKQTTGVGAGWSIEDLPLSCWAVKKDGHC